MVEETELTEIEQLERANEALKNTRQELDALCYAITHDLRAPLRVLTGFASALEEDFGDHLDGEATNYVSRIRHNARRLDEMLMSLVRLSRVGSVPLKIESVELSVIFEDVLKKAMGEESTRKIDAEVEKGVLTRGDGVLLRSALEALIENSMISTRTRERAEIVFGVKRNAPHLTLFVKDNGVGFDMAYANRLFGPFQKLHSEEAFPGIGMGLATVQRIAHRHGGRAFAEAIWDGGATFYLFLPPGGTHGDRREMDDARGEKHSVS